MDEGVKQGKKNMEDESLFYVWFNTRVDPLTQDMVTEGRRDTEGKYT